MRGSLLEMAQVIRMFGKEFNQKCHPDTFTLRVLNALTLCRTPQLGGHAHACDCCGTIQVSYNSCRNRHCPKCQASKQAIWVDDLQKETLPVKHFHIVFTVAHELNQVCLLHSAAFYSQLFASAWETLRTLGYSRYGAESGAVCVLHTWGQNLSLHPHLHCIVPAVGLSLCGNAKAMGTSGKYLYPVKQLSLSFRSHFMGHLKKWLKDNNVLPEHQQTLDRAWAKEWVVYCEPSLANAQHVVKYLGQYTHRVAITNNRIVKIDHRNVTFLHKDYTDKARQKLITLSGVEFLRRFCMHILPFRFVKIRRYGIYSSGYKVLLQKIKAVKKTLEIKLSVQERLKTLTGIDLYQCPACKQGRMVLIEVVPRVRSPTALYHIIFNNL